MEKYIEPTKDVSDRLGVSYLEVFKRMEQIRLIDKYIYPFYETLHTESCENLTSALIDTLNRWEHENR